MASSRCLLIAIALLSACERPGDDTQARVLAAKVLKGVLSYPASSIVSVSAGKDAAQLVLTTRASVQEVASWYRQALRLNGWELKSDAAAGDGSISLYADRANQPLWITLKPNAGGAGTTYTLIGAELPVDSAGAQRSGSSMSSKRIQRR